MILAFYATANPVTPTLKAARSSRAERTRKNT